MAFSPQTGGPRITLTAPPAGFLPFKKWTMHALRTLARAAGVRINIDGAESASTGSDGSLRFKIGEGGAGGSSYPFLCPATTDGSTASTIVAGTVNGVTATNLTPVISATGTKYVYLDVTYTQELSANGYVTGFDGAITCAIGTGSSIPSDTSTHLYRQIATYVSGTKTVQAIQSSMTVVARDNGSGPGTTLAIWTQA
jgi:hypothetical protein